MNPEVKKKWIEALKSGKYKQGRLTLRHTIKGEDAFCCLGVLCDLYLKENGLQWEESPLRLNAVNILHNIQMEHMYLIDGAWGILPSKVIEWAGLECHDPSVVYSTGRVPLSTLNDGPRISSKPVSKITPQTFIQIADIIEKGLSSTTPML